MSKNSESEIRVFTVQKFPERSMTETSHSSLIPYSPPFYTTNEKYRDSFYVPLFFTLFKDRIHGVNLVFLLTK